MPHASPRKRSLAAAFFPLLMCACPGRPTSMQVDIRYPGATPRPVIDLVLQPGEQLRKTGTVCSDSASTPEAWKRALEAVGYVVQLGSWDTKGMYGVRFRKQAEQLYGDVFVEWSVDRMRLCDRYVLRLQRSLKRDVPDRWTDRFSISTAGDPYFYFSQDPTFPADPEEEADPTRVSQ